MSTWPRQAAIKSPVDPARGSPVRATQWISDSMGRLAQPGGEESSDQSVGDSAS